MSKQRIVKSDFWVDSYIEELSVNERYLFLYFLTNPQTNILGIYKSSIGRIAYETKLQKSVIDQILKKFSKADKVHLVDGFIIMVNFQRHQNPNGSMRTGIKKIISTLSIDVCDFILSKKSNIYNRLSTGCYREYIDCIQLYKDINTDKDKNINQDISEDEKIEDQKRKDELKRIKLLFNEKFEIWWNLYPSRDGRKIGKQTAKDSFFNLEEKELDSFITATKKYASEIGNYAKDPERFFKRDFWKSYQGEKGQTKQQNNEKPFISSWDRLQAKKADKENQMKDITPNQTLITNGL